MDARLSRLTPPANTEMSVALTTPPAIEDPSARPHGVLAAEQAVLDRVFGVRFSILDGLSGEVLLAAEDQPARDWALRGELCREVARRRQPEFIEEQSPLMVLAVPMPVYGDHWHVGVAAFLTQPLGADDVASASAFLGLTPSQAAQWAGRQPFWTPQALERVGRLVTEHFTLLGRAEHLQSEANSLSMNLSSTYEEISLLHRLSQNLRISESDQDLARMALEWMQAVLPAEGLAIQLTPAPEDGKAQEPSARSRGTLLTSGECPLNEESFPALVAHLGLRCDNRPLVANPPVTAGADWPFPEVRQLVVVPVAEGKNVFGWMAAFNHVAGSEFGTVEASLLNSVSAILGIHSGNIELYRQQSELLTGIVRALTSAIDAKAPYTCGHSDRVARVAVRLAEELGCEHKAISTIYLSGLLHDIGKIGIDDSVLRKPGKLTDAEYEHIKTHVQIGHRILVDLRKLDDVLPVVLHHHESWDGRGYPHHLAGERIPLPARIVAVADAFDAMASDRPYRKGMPDDKIDAIFREGAARQWDPQIVEAFFRARSDLREIGRQAEDHVEIDLVNW